MDGQITRSLGAILAIDAVGYSRQMGRDEEATLRRLQAYRDLIGTIVARHGGRVFGVAGDSEMAVLPGAVEALECALAIQDVIAERNAGLPEERRMPLRIGINFGKVLIEGAGVYGDDVNIAARVEALAGKGGICLTGAVFDRVNGKLPLGYEAYGPQRFKNIGRRVRAYRVRREPLMVGRVVPGKPPIPRSHWRAVAAAALLAVAGASAWSFYLQDEMVEWRTTAAEQAAATAAARARAQALVASLEAAETRVSVERARAAELLAGLLAAERAAAERARSAQAATRAEAERAAAEAERAQALLTSLQDAEARASAEQTRAEALLAALRETEVQAAAAGDAAARRNSWEATERQAAAERERVEHLIAALQDVEARAREEALAAAERAATRAEAERATAEERARAEALAAALQAAERKAAEELRKGEALMASIEGAEGAPESERVQALLAALRAAGQTATAERKRAELLIVSWEASEDGIGISQAHLDEEAARRAVEERTAERKRAEALLVTWQDAETTAAAERARAEALLAALGEADERAAIERAVTPRRKPEPEAQDQQEEAAPETAAFTPAPLEPEDAAVAPPAAPDQLAALPSQPEATDAALSQEGETAVAPRSEAPSLDAVARLLRERREEFREKLWVYNKETGIEPGSSRLLRALKLWETQVLGIENGAYRVRVVFDTAGRNLHNFTASGVADVIVLLKVEGNDFEIVGHEDPSAPTRTGERAAPSQSGEEAVVPAIGEPSLEAVARLLRERRQEFREKLRVYNEEAGIEPVPYASAGVFKLWETRVLGIENGAYRVRAVFHPDGRKGTFFWTSVADVIVLLKVEGNDFEIVGHEDPDE